MSVHLDWEWTLAREERFGDVVGFWHTHPQGAGTQLSARDIRTMQGWVSALGKSLVCVIAEHRQVRAYVFENDTSQGRPVRHMVQIKRGTYEISQARRRRHEP
jgi:proteasome lid subunit RPN8/RPN11